jgi:hypothetical protein
MGQRQVCSDTGSKLAVKISRACAHSLWKRTLGAGRYFLLARSSTLTLISGATLSATIEGIVTL